MLQTVAQQGGREGQYWAPKPNHYTFKWLYLGNRSEQDTCSYKIFLLRMTDTMTSQNIDLSSWDTLYIYVGFNFRNMFWEYFQILNGKICLLNFSRKLFGMGQCYCCFFAGHEGVWGEHLKKVSLSLYERFALPPLGLKLPSVPIEYEAALCRE
jgi:hypothetical protein